MIWFAVPVTLITPPAEERSAVLSAEVLSTPEALVLTTPTLFKFPTVTGPAIRVVPFTSTL